MRVMKNMYICIVFEVGYCLQCKIIESYEEK